MWGRVSREQVLRQPNLFSVLPACKSKSAARPEPQEGSEEWGRRRPSILGATCSTCSCTCLWHKQRWRQKHTLNRVRLHAGGGREIQWVCLWISCLSCLVSFLRRSGKSGPTGVLNPPEGGASEHRSPEEWCFSSAALLARAAVVMATEKEGRRAQVSSPPLSQVDIRLQKWRHGVLWCRLTAESLSG